MADKEFTKNAVQDIRNQIDKEMEKPVDERDYQKIAELSQTCCELMGLLEEAKMTSETEIGKILNRSKTIRRKPSKRFYRTISVIGIAAVLLMANAVTVFATNQNIVSFVIERAEKDFSVTPIPEKVIELPTTPDDPYGIKGECAKYGLDVEVPTYLPEGFVLWNIEENENLARKDIAFWFQKGKVHFKFDYAELYDWNAKSGIPSDYFNLEEIEVNGKSAITSKEDGQYSLIYYDGNIQYLFTSDCLEYSECEKIVNSIK